jgi:hypothetical protein
MIRMNKYAESAIWVLLAMGVLFCSCDSPQINNGATLRESLKNSTSATGRLVLHEVTPNGTIEVRQFGDTVLVATISQEGRLPACDTAWGSKEWLPADTSTRIFYPHGGDCRFSLETSQHCLYLSDSALLFAMPCDWQGGLDLFSLQFSSSELENERIRIERVDRLNSDWLPYNTETGDILIHNQHWPDFERGEELFYQLFYLRPQRDSSGFAVWSAERLYEGETEREAFVAGSPGAYLDLLEQMCRKASGQ